MNDADARDICELCIRGLTPPEAITFILRDKYGLGNSATARKLSEVLKRHISPQAASNFYLKACTKIALGFKGASGE